MWALKIVLLTSFLYVCESLTSFKSSGHLLIEAYCNKWRLFPDSFEVENVAIRVNYIVEGKQATNELCKSIAVEADSSSELNNLASTLSSTLARIPVDSIPENDIHTLHTVAGSLRVVAALSTLGVNLKMAYLAHTLEYLAFKGLGATVQAIIDKRQYINASLTLEKILSAETDPDTGLLMFVFQPLQERVSHYRKHLSELISYGNDIELSTIDPQDIPQSSHFSQDQKMLKLNSRLIRNWNYKSGIKSQRSNQGMARNPPNYRPQRKYNAKYRTKTITASPQGAASRYPYYQRDLRKGVAGTNIDASQLDDEYLR